MIVNVSGYGSTGASACTDLLKEFSGFQFFEGAFELQLLQEPSGIINLMNGVYNGNRLTNQTETSRFLRNIKNNRRNDSLNIATKNKLMQITDEYIRSLDIVSWRGFSSFDPIDTLGVIERHGNNTIMKYLYRLYKAFLSRLNMEYGNERYAVTVSIEEFINNTKGYLRRILEECGIDLLKPVVIEQLCSCMDPLLATPFFDERLVSFIVDRDPRDLYIITNHIFPKLNRFMPHSGDVSVFVKYFKSIHGERIKDDNVFYLQYEDLIYRYDETKKKISDLLGLEHEQTRTFFRPEYSINNTNLVTKYSELSNEVSYIERHLSEYLYDFQKASKTISFDPVITKPFEHQECIIINNEHG